MPIRDLTGVKKHVLLCNGEKCTSRGSAEVTALIRKSVIEEGLFEDVHTTKTLCNGRCEDGPIVIVYPEGVWYKEVNEDVAKQIILEHLKNGHVINENLLFVLPKENE